MADANGGYDADRLATLVPTLVACGVRLLEQPFARGDEALLDALAVPVRVATDESLLSIETLPALVGRYQVANIKLDKCGGLTEAIEIAAAARRLGLGVMVGNMGGSSLVAPSLQASLGLSDLALGALPVIGGRLGRGKVRPMALASLFTALAVLPGLSLLLAAAPWHAYAAVGAQVCLGVATAALMPGVLQEIAPDHLRARVLSLPGIVTGVTQGVSPLLVGWLSGLFAGPRGILAAMVLVGAPGWLASAFLYRRGRTLLRA